MTAPAQPGGRLRLACAAAMLAAVFLAPNLARLAAVYLLVLLAVAAGACLRRHLRVLVLLAPLLAGLLLLWALVLPPTRLPPGHASGAGYALFGWLRIAAAGGVFQALLLPLADHPLRLRAFLDACGLRGAPAVLVMASVVLLPEMRRRIAQVADARRAQGYRVRGWSGLRQLPQLLMPLTAALLDTAARRAELWNHRGILARPAAAAAPERAAPSPGALLAAPLAALLGCAALALGLWP